MVVERGTVQLTEVHSHMNNRNIQEQLITDEQFLSKYGAGTATPHRPELPVYLKNLALYWL